MATTSDTDSRSPSKPSSSRPRQRRRTSGQGGGPPSQNRNRQRGRPGDGDRKRKSGSRPAPEAKPSPPGFFSRILIALGLKEPELGVPRGPGEPKRVARVRAAKTDPPPSNAVRSGGRGGGRPDGDRPAPTRREPELVEVTSPRLYVGNLSYDATENDLTELFRGVGQVESAEIVSHRRTERSKGYAFVTMLAVEDAKRAVTELHDKDFMGRKLVVSGAKSPGPDGESSET